MMHILRLLRLLRVVRLAHIFKSIRPLHRLAVGLMEAWHGMKWVIVLTVILLYVMSIVFTDLVGHGIINEDEELRCSTGSECLNHKELPEEVLMTFGTTARSLFSLFKLMNTDMTIADSVSKSVAGQFLFALFMVASNWMILAVLTSVVSDHMITSSTREVREDDAKEAEKFHVIKTRRLLTCFQEVDYQETGKITSDDFLDLLADQGICQELCSASQMSEGDLKDLYYCLCDKNQDIRYHEFVEVLHSQGEEADQRAIHWCRADIRDAEMRIEKMLRTLKRATNKKLRKRLR